MFGGSRRAKSGLLVVALGAAACGSPGPAPTPPAAVAISIPPMDAGQPLVETAQAPSTSPASPSQEVLPPETPPPPADFTSLADVLRAGAASVGKMVRLPLRRDYYTSADHFTAVPCAEKKANSTIRMSYRPEQRAYVRALYVVTPKETCGTVSFRVKTFRGGGAALVEAQLEHVGTVAPKRAATPAPGADYASIDDAILAGAEAKGKIIAGRFSVYDATTDLWVHDCLRHDSFLFVVPKTTAQSALAQQLKASARPCVQARLLMVDPDYVSVMGGESLKRPLAEVASIP